MAATVTRIGTQSYAELSPEYVRQGRVWFTTRRWRGLKADLLDIADAVDGEARLVEEAFPWFILNVTFQGQQTGGSPPSPDSQVTTLYTLDGPQRIDPIWQLPEVWADMQRITNLSTRAKFKARMEAFYLRGENYVTEVSSTGVSSNVELTEANVISFGVSGGATDSVMRTLAAEFSRGVESFAWDNVVLTKQTVAPNASSVRATYNRRNAIYRTATILSQNPGMPNIIKGNMRAHLASGYWLRGSPRIEQIDAQTSRMTETYVYGETYSTAIYGNPN